MTHSDELHRRLQAARETVEKDSEHYPLYTLAFDFLEDAYGIAATIATTREALDKRERNLAAQFMSQQHTSLPEIDTTKIRRPRLEERIVVNDDDPDEVQEYARLAHNLLTALTRYEQAKIERKELASEQYKNEISELDKLLSSQLRMNKLSYAERKDRHTRIQEKITEAQLDALQTRKEMEEEHTHVNTKYVRQLELQLHEIQDRITTFVEESIQLEPEIASLHNVIKRQRTMYEPLRRRLEEVLD